MTLPRLFTSYSMRQTFSGDLAFTSAAPILDGRSLRQATNQKQLREKRQQQSPYMEHISNAAWKLDKAPRILPPLQLAAFVRASSFCSVYAFIAPESSAIHRAVAKISNRVPAQRMRTI